MRHHIRRVNSRKVLKKLCGCCYIGGLKSLFRVVGQFCLKKEVVQSLLIRGVAGKTELEMVVHTDAIELLKGAPRDMVSDAFGMR